MGLTLTLAGASASQLGIPGGSGSYFGGRFFGHRYFGKRYFG